MDTHKPPPKPPKASPSVVHILPKTDRRVQRGSGRALSARGERVSRSGRAPGGPRPAAAGPPARPSPAVGGDGGSERRNWSLPPLPAPSPRSRWGRRGSRRGRAGGRGASGSWGRPAALAAEPGGEAVPAAGVAQPARGEEGRGSKFTPFPVPSSAPPRGRGAMALLPPRPACGGPPSLSCGDSALSSSCHYSGRDPSSKQTSPHPSEETRGRRGCV